MISGPAQISPDAARTPQIPMRDCRCLTLPVISARSVTDPSRTPQMRIQQRTRIRRRYRQRNHIPQSDVFPHRQCDTLFPREPEYIWSGLHASACQRQLPPAHTRSRPTVHRLCAPQSVNPQYPAGPAPFIMRIGRERIDVPYANAQSRALSSVRASSTKRQASSQSFN